MPASYVYKAEGDRGKKGIFLAPQEDARSNPFAVLSDGRRIEGRYVNTNEGRHQYLFGNDILGQKGVKIDYNGKQIALDDSNKSYEGANPYDGWSYRNKGDLGSGGGSGGGGGGGGGAGSPNFTPSQTGFGVYPANLDGFFPDPSLIHYTPITAAPYKYVDPQETTAKIGEFNRGEVKKNFDLSRDIALQELDTELKGLSGFVPAASALKRSEIAKDNPFNQDQRTAQVNAAMPNAARQYAEQGSRAEAYASGRAPDEVTDKGYELTSRSAAADRANAGGFGANSSVSKKASDLMSADRRIALSQYGDNLLTSNINETAKLFLAPTEYSDAGNQVRVTPEIGGARLQSGALSDVNNLTTLSPANALTADIGQQQFLTNLEQGTRTFNATNDLNAQQFNANTENSFALQHFAYRVGYAGTVAGAAQTDINTQLAIAQQASAKETFQDQMATTQRNNSMGALAGGLGTIGGAIIGGMVGGPAGAMIGASVGGSLGASLGGGGGGGSGSLIPNNALSGTSSGSNGGGGSGDSGGGSSSGSSQPSGGGNYSLGSLGEFGPGGTPQGFQPSMASAPVSSFMQNGMGQSADSPLVTQPNAEVTKALLSSSAPVMNDAGVSNTPQPQYVDVGVNNIGAPVYMNPGLLKSSYMGAGADRVDSVGQILSPMGVFGDEADQAKLGELGKNASDASLIGTLNGHAVNNDAKGFMSTLEGAVGGADSLSSKFTGYQLSQNWGQMSDSQKSLGVASLGLQNFKFSDGSTMATKALVKGADGQTELSLRDGVALLQKGVNAYPLVNKWDQFKMINSVAAGGGDGLRIADSANSLGLLGAGTKGAEVPGVTMDKLTKDGWKPVPHLGVGSVASDSRNPTIPQGYSPYKLPNGTTVATPKKSVATSANAISNSLVSTAGGDNGTSQNAVKIHQGWGAAPTQNKGSEGGSALVGGLTGLAATNPMMLGGIVAGNVAKNSFGGKGGDQKSRDDVRGTFKDSGLLDSKYNVTLADGSKFNVGVDGKGGMRGDLHSYDTDFSNDLDYTAGMGGITLSRLIKGGSGKGVDQFGSQLGNAALGNVGYGKEFNRDTFGQTQNNLRAIYSQSGIKSKADGYQLANLAFSEGRMNETELAATQQTLNVVFDKDGFDTASKLMAGRDNGLKAAASQTVSAISAPGNKAGGPVQLDRNGVQVGYRAQLPTLPAYLEKWVDRGQGYPGDKEKKEKDKGIFGDISKTDIATGLLLGPGALATKKILGHFHL